MLLVWHNNGFSALHRYMQLCSYRAEVMGDQALPCLSIQAAQVNVPTNDLVPIALLKRGCSKPLQSAHSSSVTETVWLMIQVAYASSPSWMLYDGKHESCSDTIPMAVSRGVFCENYHGDARIFELYAPWILAMLLGHNNLLVHSYPEILFKAARWTVTGRANCAMDKAPKVSHSAFQHADLQ